MASLTVHGLSRPASGATPALRAIRFAIEDGRIAAVLGPRGSGKTALLRLIAGLERPEVGQVEVGGIDVTRIAAGRRGIELLAQEIALIPGKDVRENVERALLRSGLARTEREAPVAELLAAFGLSALGAVRPVALSDLDGRRVACARTLVAAPGVALFDEPFGALVGEERRVLRRELRAALHNCGATAILATADVDDAAAVADEVVVLAAGRVLQSGPIDAVMAGPASSGVAALLGYVTLARGEVRNHRVVEEEVGAIAIPLGMPVGDGARVMAHPASLIAVPASRGLGCGASGRVLAVHPVGATHRLEIAVGTRVVEAPWEWDLLAPAVGAVVELAVRPETLRFFEDPGGTAMRLPG